MPPLHTGEEAAAEAPAKSSPPHPSSTRNPKARRSRQHSSPNVPSHATNKFLHCLRSAPVKVICRLKFQTEEIYRYFCIFHYGDGHISFTGIPPALWNEKCELDDCRPFLPYLTFIKTSEHEVITKLDGSMKLPARGWLRTCLRDRHSTGRAELFFFFPFPFSFLSC